MKKILSLTLALCLLLLSGCNDTPNVNVYEDEVAEVTAHDGNDADISNEHTTSIDVTAGTEKAEEITTHQTSNDTPEDTPTSSYDDIENIKSEDSDRKESSPDVKDLTDTYLSKVISSDDGDNVRYICEYTYDEFGNLVEATYAEGTSSLQKRLYEYDKFGRVVKYSIFENNFLNDYYTYAYDSHDRLLCRRHHAPDGSIIYDEMTVVYTYNTLGKLVEEVQYTGSKDEYIRTVHSYDYIDDGEDKKGLVTANVITVRHDGMLIAKSEYKYGKNGITVYESYTNHVDGTSYTIVSEITDIVDGYYYVLTTNGETNRALSNKKYDADGNLVMEEMFDNNNQLYCTNTYIDSGELMGSSQKTMESTDADGNLTYEYTESFYNGVKTAESTLNYYSDADGDHISSTLVTYGDDYTQTIEKIDGEVFSNEVVRFDENGNVLSSVVEVDGSVRELENKYSPEGNIIMITNKLDGKITTMIEFEYITIEGAYHEDPHEFSDMAFGFEL